MGDPAARRSTATCPSETVRSAGWGFDKINHFPNGSLYACVASDDHTVLIAFRGTDDPKDWLVNTDAMPQSVPHGIIHRGFYQAMKTLYAEVAAAATAQGVEKKNLWITGHSLGGALAVAFAYEILAEGRLARIAAVFKRLGRISIHKCRSAGDPDLLQIQGLVVMGCP